MIVDAFQQNIKQITLSLQPWNPLIEEGSPLITAITDHLAALKNIVQETLLASTAIQHSFNTNGADDYDRLLADLSIWEGERQDGKEQRLEQECAAEFARKSQIATMDDLDYIYQKLVAI